MTTVMAVSDVSGVTPQRRRRGRAVGGVLLVVALILSVGAWRYATTYAPLGPGSFWGPYYVHGASHLRTRLTDLGDEIYVDGPAGTAAQAVTSLLNNGPHAVTVTGFLNNALITDIQWTPLIVPNGGVNTGLRLPLRPLPAQVGAHQDIRLVITFRKPRCESGVYFNTDEAILHWHALGVHHDYVLPLETGGSAAFVGCPHHLK